MKTKNRTYTEEQIWAIVEQNDFSSTECEDDEVRTIQIAKEEDSEYFGEFREVKGNKFVFIMYFCE
jgi:hypothetical protein